MSMHLVGNKRLFGIEFIPIQKYDYKRGHIKIWINNFAVGYPLDDDFFFFVVSQLEGMISTSEHFRELDTKTNEEILDLLLNEENIVEEQSYSAAKFHLGESFDEYFILVLKTKERRLKLLIASKDFIKDAPLNYLSITIDVSYLRNLIDDFVSILKSYNPGLEL